VSLQSSPDKLLSRKDVLIIAVTVIVSLALYLVFSAVTYRIGFPLDDAWIHQTYARNLALRGEWSFLPGELSAGSTSPLWTILLSIGFLLHLSPYIWTYFLGGLFLFGISLLVELILRRTAPRYKPNYPWVGCLFAVEWHLVWAAISGMETILHIFLVLFVIGILLTRSRNYLLAGIIVGISIWVRPDGLTLLGPLFLATLLTESSMPARLRALLRLVLGFGVFFFPYLLFNLVISGTPMPNTFYAKQAEYIGWQASPFGDRFVFLALQFFQGVSFVLIPGFIQKIITAVRERAWGVLLAVVWMFGYIILYLLRLPVYQHGRYFMPALSVFLLIGVSGFVEILDLLRIPRRRTIRIAFLSALFVILSISFIFGGYTYSHDVAYIESQMVDTARWVALNVPQDGKIAAHDIGALGYFGQHSIVDLAGLISPEIIPIINDEKRLSVYMDDHAVRYLVAFSGWRPLLSLRGRQLFTAGNNPDAQSEQGNMVVYSWDQP
jgi:hypothetical protein